MSGPRYLAVPRTSVIVGTSVIGNYHGIGNQRDFVNWQLLRLPYLPGFSVIGSPKISVIGNPGTSVIGNYGDFGKFLALQYLPGLQIQVFIRTQVIEY